MNNITAQENLDRQAEIELAALEGREVEHDCGRVPNPEDSCQVCEDLYEARIRLEQETNKKLEI